MPASPVLGCFFSRDGSSTAVEKTRVRFLLFVLVLRVRVLASLFKSPPCFCYPKLDLHASSAIDTILRLIRTSRCRSAGVLGLAVRKTEGERERGVAPLGLVVEVSMAAVAAVIALQAKAWCRQ